IGIALGSYYFLTRPVDSIAVLPFTIVNPDPAAEQMADEIAQRTINNLSQMSGLRVISFNSVQQYKGKQVDPQSVGRELDVRAVLLGRLFKRNNSLIVSLELIDARDRRQLWNMERPVKTSDYLLAPGEIVGPVLNTVGVRISAAEKNRLDAESSYAKGRIAWNLRTVDSLNEAIRHFETALK